MTCFLDPSRLPSTAFPPSANKGTDSRGGNVREAAETQAAPCSSTRWPTGTGITGDLPAKAATNRRPRSARYCLDMGFGDSGRFSACFATNSWTNNR